MQKETRTILTKQKYITIPANKNAKQKNSDQIEICNDPSEQKMENRTILTKQKYITIPANNKCKIEQF